MTRKHLWFTPNDISGPIRYLESMGWTQSAGALIKPSDEYEPSDYEWACVTFLTADWDFTYANKPGTVDPVIIRATDTLQDSDARMAWLKEQSDDAAAQGVTFARASYNVDTNDTLFEGWLERPNDQGAPRFNMAARNVEIHVPPAIEEPTPEVEPEIEPEPEPE